MKKTKLLLIIISFVVFIVTCTLSVNATEVIKSGSAGSATWTLYDDGRMVIKGSGEVEEPVYREQKKIKSLSATLKAKVKTLILDDRITSIGHDWDSEDPFGTYVFANYINLENVELPSNLTYITHSAFENCKSLTRIDIPGSVETVGSGAFFDCEKLEELTLNEGIEMLDDYAFQGCIALKSIHIPKTITKMYGRGIFRVFAYCENLEEITVADDNPQYTSKDSDGNECNAIIRKKNKTLYLACKNTTKPEGITSIDEEAFRWSNIENIELPDSLTKIGESAFEGCDKLKSVDFGNGVTEIGESAFEDCVNLESVDLGNSVTEIGKSAFEGCIGMESLDLGNSVTEIGESAFEYCGNLKSINLPSSLKKIGDFAFYKTGLESVKILGSIKIGTGAFSNLKKLEYSKDVDQIDRTGFSPYYLECIKVDIDNAKYTSRDENEEECDAIIEKATNKLIIGCKGTKIPTNVEIIGDDAFGGCDISNLQIPEGVKIIEDWAFCGCQGVDTIKLPNTLTVLGEKSFIESSIKNIEIPENVSTIKSSTFENCKSLTNVKVSNKVNKIEKNAFKGCNLLKDIILPNKALYIDKTVFTGCKTLSANSKKSIYNANKKYIQKTSAKGIKLKTSKRKITVTWTGVSDKNVKPIAYVVYRGTKAKKLKKIGTVKTKKYIDKKGLRKGRKYYYKVVGKVKNLNGKYCYTKPTVVKNIRCK